MCCLYLGVGDEMRLGLLTIVNENVGVNSCFYCLIGFMMFLQSHMFIAMIDIIDR